MASWSAKRRVLYLAGTAGVFLVLGVLLYGRFFYSPPSCADGLLNQGELGIDCGGSCARVCPNEVSGLSILWSQVFRVSSSLYDAAALLKNPNVGFGARSLSYTFRIYDKQNIAITEKKGGTYLNENEDFIIFEPAIDVGRRIPARAFLTLDPPKWERLPVDRREIIPRVTVSSKRLELEPALRLTALLANTSFNDITNLEVTAALYDAKDNVVAVSRTTVRDLPRHEERTLTFTWPETFDRLPTRFEIIPRFNHVALPLSR